jgi:hypothetical protein
VSSNRYSHFGRANLTPPELFFYVTLNEARKELGLGDLAATSAILLGQNDVPVAGKLAGATAGTSIASLASRMLLPFNVQVRLPMITSMGVKGMRIAFTRNLGAFVGRTIPVVGTVMLARSAVSIMRNTIAAYNRLVLPEDQVF